MAKQYFVMVNGEKVDTNEALRLRENICGCGAACTPGYCRERRNRRYDSYEGHRGNE
jgi:hypothetical protein